MSSLPWRLAGFIVMAAGAAALAYLGQALYGGRAEDLDVLVRIGMPMAFIATLTAAAALFGGGWIVLHRQRAAPAASPPRRRHRPF
ncbi:MAG TPA: hypothetical protein VG939_04545 [Caulobacteraceae bacterium]|nr:hypothetical protein [Caulobacteraceae bacterium]